MRQSQSDIACRHGRRHNVIHTIQRDGPPHRRRHDARVLLSLLGRPRIRRRHLGCASIRLPRHTTRQGTRTRKGHMRRRGCRHRHRRGRRRGINSACGGATSCSRFRSAVAMVQLFPLRQAGSRAARGRYVQPFAAVDRAHAQAPVVPCHASARNAPSHA